ncbi:hypothetical protein GGR57DRAFT_209647 [Xylariaceae sp. FL1272]|nr:hypothetical protein GGR57DRAFT_209647 [Xylariaceae sp. FL1272]
MALSPTYNPPAQITSIYISRRFIGTPVRNSKGNVPSALHAGDHVLWDQTTQHVFDDDTDSPHICGSLHPVAVNITLPKHSRVNITIKILDHRLLNDRITIWGSNDVAENIIRPVEPATTFTRTGQYTMEMKVAPVWRRDDIPWGIAGNMVWKVKHEDTGRVECLNSSRLEFYAIKGTPPSFFGIYGVPVKLLRRVVLPRRVWPRDSTWEEYCSTIAFQGFRYDIHSGAPRYFRPAAIAGERTTFRLATYLDDIGSGQLVNCYDQASAMQIFLALSPTVNSVEWMFMAPFGFINTTVLVGRGACNNPFYEQAGEPRRPKICSAREKWRTAFANHAFVRVNHGSIVDACCGPRFGGTLRRFIESSIDQVFPPGIITRPGQERHATVRPGVQRLI